jgi:predicted DNA-binding protein with PD1-like motif
VLWADTFNNYFFPETGDTPPEPRLHAHVVVGKSDGTAYGGHLLRARVRPTLEVLLIESPKHLARYSDPDSGLALLKL